MALYRLFLFRDGELVGEVKRHCADDLDALEAARALCDYHVVEVYCELRFIARVKQDDPPLRVRDWSSL